MAYTMKDLQERTQKTPQTIRRVLRTYPKAVSLIPEHRTETANGKVFFDDAILSCLLEYFGIEAQPPENEPLSEESVGGGIMEEEASANPQTNPAPPTDESPAEAEAEATQDDLLKRIAELEAQLANERQEHADAIADLTQQLKDKDGERLHFISENAKLLALLAAEKQEKQAIQLMLPPPRRTIGDRIRALFGKNKEAANNE